MRKAERDAQEVRRLWSQVSAPERAEIVGIFGEVHRPGPTLSKVWEFYRTHAARMAVVQTPMGEKQCAKQSPRS
jgi:hypothetical protein